MTRWTWALLLALYGVVGLAVPFVGYSLPMCLGNAAGQMSPACVVEWQATMPLFPQRVVYVLGVPMSAAVTFFASAAVTLVFDLAQRLRRASGDMRGPS
jgi:hypothetical protein